MQFVLTTIYYNEGGHEPSMSAMVQTGAPLVPLEKKAGNWHPSINAGVYAPFFVAGTLTLLIDMTVWLVRNGDFFSDFGMVGDDLTRLHITVQWVGWVALFVMGITFHGLPRLRQCLPFRRRWIWVPLWLNVIGQASAQATFFFEQGGLRDWWGFIAIMFLVVATIWFCTQVLLIYRHSPLDTRSYDMWFQMCAFSFPIAVIGLLLTWLWPDLVWLVEATDALAVDVLWVMLIVGLGSVYFIEIIGWPPEPPDRMENGIVIFFSAMSIHLASVIMQATGYGDWWGFRVTYMFPLLTAAWVLLPKRIWREHKVGFPSSRFIGTAFTWLLISILMVSVGVFTTRMMVVATRHALLLGFAGQTLVGISTHIQPGIRKKDPTDRPQHWLTYLGLNIAVFSLFISAVPWPGGGFIFERAGWYVLATVSMVISGLGWAWGTGPGMLSIVRRHRWFIGVPIGDESSLQESE